MHCIAYCFCHNDQTEFQLTKREEYITVVLRCCLLLELNFRHRNRQAIYFKMSL